MYIRKVESKLRDGTSARYVQLAHNFRDPKSNRSRAQVLYSFGREDQVDHDALKRLVSSIERFLSPEEALKLKAQRDTELVFKESRPLGGAWTLQQLWTEIGIDRVIKKGLRKRSFSAPIERAIFAMVANRALAPKSKLSVESWANDDVCLPGVDDLQVQHLYRSLDVVLDMEDKLQEEVFFSVSHLLNLEVDLLFFDTTSTYFEIEGEDIPSDPEDEAYVLRRQGYSKDSRPDLAQVVIGLAVTREGIPIRVWTWPGNTADVTRVKQVKEDLIGWKLGRVITVLDRGFMSEANLRELQKAGGHYIIGEKMQAGKPMVEEALSRAGRYQSVTHNVEVKELVVGDGEARKRYITVKMVRREKSRRIRLRGHPESLMVADLEAERHHTLPHSFAAHIEAAFGQRRHLSPRPVSATVIFVDGLDGFIEFCVISHLLFSRQPRVIALSRNAKNEAEQPQRVVRPLRVNEVISHSHSLAKKAVAFFKMSRSISAIFLALSSSTIRRCCSASRAFI